MAEAASAPKARESRQVTIPASLHERLQSEADRRDVSVTFLATKAIDRVLPVWEKIDLSRTFDEAPAE